MRKSCESGRIGDSRPARRAARIGACAAIAPTLKFVPKTAEFLRYTWTAKPLNKRGCFIENLRNNEEVQEIGSLSFRQ